MARLLTVIIYKRCGHWLRALVLQLIIKCELAGALTFLTSVPLNLYRGESLLGLRACLQHSKRLASNTRAELIYAVHSA